LPKTVDIFHPSNLIGARYTVFLRTQAPTNCESIHILYNSGEHHKQGDEG